MSTHLGDGKSGGKTGDSSQMTENKRRLALARSYTQSSKNPKNVTSLGLVNSSEQIQSNITVGTTYEVLSQITGTIVYQGQLTELAIDYPALIAALSIQLNIPASNLRVSVRAGSVIIDWSTIVPIIKTYTPPDVRTIVSGLQESLITNPIAGISLVNGGSVTASITKTATNSTVLSMPEGVLEYVLSATDTTIRVNGIPPGTYPYTENSGISGILGTSHILPSLRPDTLYTITIGNGRSQAIRTARSFTLAAAGRDVTVSGLASNTTYLYSVNSGVTWLILAANRVIPNVLPGLQTIQIMVQNLVPNIGVGVASATVTVTLGVPSVPTYTFQGQNATFTVPTLPYLNAAGYVYTLNIVNTTNSADTPAPSTVNSGSATVRGFILTDTYTASVTVTSADGVHTATSPVITLLLPPTPPSAPIISVMSPTSLKIQSTGLLFAMTYEYSVDDGASWKTLTTPGQTGLSTHIADGLVPGRTYSVRIRAINTSGSASSVKSNSIILPAGTPTIVPTSITSLMISNIGTEPNLQYFYSLNGDNPVPVTPVGSSTQTVSNLSPATQYSVQIWIVNPAEPTAPNNISAMSNTIVLRPSAPATPTLSVNGNIVTLTNTDSPVQIGCSYSYILTTAGVAGTATPLSTSSIPLTLAYNTAYSVTVTATSLYDSTIFSTSLPSITRTTPPATPTSPTVTASGNTITITNTDAQSGCQYGYQVLNGTTQVMNGTFTGTNTATTSGLAYNTTYTVTVTATNVGSTSTSPVSITTPLNTPSTPTFTANDRSFTITNTDTPQPSSSYSYTIYYGANTVWNGGSFSGSTPVVVNGAGYNTQYRVVTVVTSTLNSSNTATSLPAYAVTPPVPLQTPTLTVSGNTITIKNNDNQLNCAYTYKVLQGTTTFATGSIPGGGTASAMNAAYNTAYTVTVTATTTYTQGVNVSATSSAASITTPVQNMSVPAAPTFTASGTTLTLTNADTPQTSAAYTYTIYSAPGVVWRSGSFTGTTPATVTGASNNTQYSAITTVTSTIDASKTANSVASYAITSLVPLQAPSLSASGTTLTVTNNDNQPNCEYTYKILQGTTTFATGSISGGGTATAPNAAYNTTYTVTVTATTTYTQGVNVTVTSSAASITTPNTITYNSIDKPIPAGGFTLASSSLLTCTLIGGGGGVAFMWPGGGGGSLIVQSPGIRLKSGSVITINTPNGGISTGGNGSIGDACNLTVKDASNVTQLLLRAYGGNTDGLGIGGKYAIITNITGTLPNITGSSDGTTVADNSVDGGVAGGAPAGSSYGSGGKVEVTMLERRKGSIGYYSITITPTSTLTISTPTLNTVAGSTSLTVGNIDNTPGYTYAYSIDGGTTYTPVTGSSIQINNVNPGIYIASIKATVTATGVSDISSPSTPVTIPMPTLATPVLSQIAGSYTTLLLSNITTGYGLSYSYTLDNGVTYTPVVGNTTVISNLTSENAYTAKIYAVSTSSIGLTLSATSAASNSVSTRVSTPTLSLIPGSGTTLLLGNVDSLPGVTYYYTLNTQSAGTYTAITTLDKLGSGYIVRGLVRDQDYRIGITAKYGTDYGPISAYSSPAIRITIPTPSRPTLSLISGSYSLLLGNVDSLPGFTYYYKLGSTDFSYTLLNAGTYTAISSLEKSGSGYILRNLEPQRLYEIRIAAMLDGVYGGDSAPSFVVDIPAIIPKPSTPTLQTIPGSYTTLLLGNVDSVPGFTYYYTLNTESAGTYTAIANLEKSGSGYIVTGLVPNQDYTIGITAKYGTEYGPISTYSLAIVRTAKTATPTLSLIPGSATTLLVGNVENVAGYTYYYSVNGLVFDNVVPLSRIITGLNYATTYVVYIEARGAGNISNISLVSNTVTTPFPVGTLRYRYDPSSIYSTTIYTTSFPDFAVVNQTGDLSVTLTQDMILTATIIGAGQVTPQQNGTVRKGGRINITNMRLSAGVKVIISVAKEATMNTGLSVEPTGLSSVTQTSLLRAGGGGNSQAQDNGTARIIFDAYGTSPYTTLIPEGGIGSSTTGAYYIQLVPA
jgi:hypothetical protein